MSPEHLTGAAALLVTAAGYAMKNDRALRATALCGLALFLVHMALIAAWWTAGVMALAVVMLSAAYAGWRRLSLAGWAVGVLALPVAALGVFPGGAWLSMVPVTAGIVINSSLLFASGCWLTLGLAAGEVLTIWNAVLVGSPWAAVANLMALSALAVRTVRRHLEIPAPVAAGV